MSLQVNTNYYVCDAETPNLAIGKVMKLRDNRFQGVVYKKPFDWSKRNAKPPIIQGSPVFRPTRRSAEFAVRSLAKSVLTVERNLA